MAILGVDLAHRGWVIALGPELLRKDSLDYWRFGLEVASGHPLMEVSAQAFRTPLYPYFLSVFQAVFGRDALLAATVAQHLLGVATAVLTGLLCARLCSRPRPGFLLGLGLGVVSFGRVWGASLVLTETVFTFLLVLHALLVVRWVGSHPFGIGRGLALGVTLGLLTLVRPVAQLLIVVDLVVLTVAWRRGLRGRGAREPALRAAAVVIAAFLSTLFPWVMRNVAIHGEAFLVRFQGRSLWLSAFHDEGAGLELPPSTAAAAVVERVGEPLRKGFNHWDVYAALRTSGLSEVDADRLMRVVAVEAIRAHPVRYLGSVVRRAGRFWYTTNASRSPLLEPEPGATLLDQEAWGLAAARPAYGRLLAVFFHPSPVTNLLVALAVVAALALVARRGEPVAVVWMTATLAYFTLVTCAAELPNYRYRMVLEPLMVAALVSGVCPREHATRAAAGGRSPEAPR